MSSRSNVAVGPMRITPLSLCLREQISPQAMVCTAGVYTADVKVRSWQVDFSPLHSDVQRVSGLSFSMFQSWCAIQIAPSGFCLRNCLLLYDFCSFWQKNLSIFVQSFSDLVNPCHILSYLVMRQMCLLRNMCVSCASIFYSGPGGVARDTRRSAQDCPESRGQEIKRSESQTLFDIWYVYIICV